LLRAVRLVQGNMTPLHRAARDGHLTLVQELVKAGASLGARTGVRPNQAVQSLLLPTLPYCTAVTLHPANTICSTATRASIWQLPTDASRSFERC
jgi:ankyrin repeat protein